MSNPPPAHPGSATSFALGLPGGPLADPVSLCEALAGSTGAMIAFFTADGRIGWTNLRFAEWFGVAPEDLIGRALLDVYSAESYVAFSPFVARALAGEHVRYERLLERPEQPPMWISVSLHPHRNETGEVLGILACSLEVDELKRTRDALDKAQQMQAHYLENSPLAVIEWDAEVRVRRWSGQAERIFGWRAEEVLGERSRDIGLVHPDWVPTIRAATVELLDGLATRNRMISRNKTKSGKYIYCEWFNSAFVDPGGQARGIFSLAQDVTLRVEADEQLRHAAVHDALTGCHNRQSLIARLEHALARARRTGDKLAILFTDLDRFKPVNDTHGHLIGDALLQAVGARLRECVRETDTVARVGGDEFVVLLETEVQWQTPEVLRQRIAEGFRSGFRVGDLALDCGASIGIARYPEDGDSPDDLLMRADQAMYREKAKRN
ncbi:MAG: diguanylate cyclase [Betaproteobacteria bacterium]|nr:diguanylate cyclase [Betaproteobacteria bacterium]